MGQNPQQQAAEEALAQLMARLWFALQSERLYLRSNQWTREYQAILLSLDVARNLRSKAIKLFAAGLALAAGASMAAGALIARALIRGTGPLGRLLAPTPAAYQAAVAAEASQAAAAVRLVGITNVRFRALQAAGLQWAPPPWIVRHLIVMPGVLLRRLWQERAMRITLGMFASLPMVLATAQVAHWTSSRDKPRGSLGTLKHLFAQGDPEWEIKLSLQRAEQIISGFLDGLSDNQKALFAMTDDELMQVMVQLDSDLLTRLREDPRLRRENLSDEMYLFLRAQMLMDYWLGVQNWVDALRPSASRELQEFAQQFR